MKQNFASKARLLCSGTALFAIAIASTPLSAQGRSEDGAQHRSTTASNETGAARDEGPYQIRFRADTLVISPVLTVRLVDRVRTAVRGKAVQFQAYNNYPSFVDRAEIRIFAAGASPDGEPLATLDVDANGTAEWTASENDPEALFYVLRVYGGGEKFDETYAHELTLLDAEVAQSLGSTARSEPSEILEPDEADRRAISLEGIMATVTGRADPDNEQVFVSGRYVGVDAKGNFAEQQIVSRVDGELEVSIERDGQEIYRVAQDYSAPSDDWFVVAQGDLTLGTSFGSGPSREVSGDPSADGSYAIGRGAFYAKGIVGDEWRITSSLDTGEELLEDIFSNLDRKDPRQLLRRLNSEQFYPTYGDDSTLVEDAPTQGAFYLRVARDASQFVIGNFTTSVNGAELAQLDRGLFGALVDLNSNATTEFGERRFQAVGFASDPGTVPGREEFRGTGGSLYFLQRQDISIGSERVRIEVRDRETGLVLESRDLFPQQDYDFDPLQGRLTLLQPLSSAVASGGVVREGSSTGDVPVLVVRYEFTPTLSSLDGYTFGGRATGWIGDFVRLGATAQRDTVEEASQTVFGADVLVRASAETYFKAEFAQSSGPGFGQANSVDGGLTFTNIAAPGIAGVEAQAFRTEGAVALADLMGAHAPRALLSGFFEHQDAGFSSAGRLSPTETERWGLDAKIPFATGQLAAGYETLSSGNAGSSETAVFDVQNRFAIATGSLTAKIGLRHEDRVPGQLFNSVQDGSRTDSAIELGYAPGSQNWSAYSFGQVTLDHDQARQRNDRFGGGLTAQLTERLSVNGEISGGDGGLGSDIQLNRRLGDGSEAYVGYSLFTDSTDTGFNSQNIFTRANRGSLVLGARQRFSDSLSVYGENRIGIGGTTPSVTRNFGLEFEPLEYLSLTGTFETGRIDDATTGVFRRTAASLGVGFSKEDARIGSIVELRRETSPLGLDQTVWLFRNDASFAVNPDWRFVGRFNLAEADNSSSSISAAEFTEAVAGFAYRPVHNERLTALVRFTYFEDLGPVGQITGSGQIESPRQVSHIGLIDVNYDLTESLTIGGRYGYRTGRVSLGRESDQFVSSTAHLAVLRADYSVLKKFDVLVEGRALWSTAAEDLRIGALAAVYRSLNENVKIGLGYSLSDFSDDLTDQSFSSHGPFINFLAKY